MKRSEFLAHAESGLVGEEAANIIRELERENGVKWDPEEPELPKFLRVSVDGANHARLWPGDSTWNGDAHELAGYQAAADAYNRLQRGEAGAQKAADVISKTKGGRTIHYAVGPTRETRDEAERDLREWFDKEAS